MTTANRIFSLFSFLGLVLCCLPLRQHMQAWNAGTCLNIAWTVLACLNFFINSVIWNDNLSNPAPVWCDISTRVDIACNIAIPVAFLCTLRRIYLITTGNMPSAIATLKKRHAVMCDFTAGLGIPLVVVILAYIPQNSRFAIYEDFGCVTAISNTPVGILLRNLPQLVVSLACVVYSGLTLRHLYKKYSELNEHLSSGNTINKSQYLRVLIIATLGSICVFPFSFYWFVTNWTTVYSWQGWKQVHSNFSDVYIIPNSFWRANPSSQYGTEVSRWAFVFNAFAIFVCFGIHEEARKNYLSAVQYILRYAPWFHIEKCFVSIGIMCAIELTLFFIGLEHPQNMTQDLRVRRCRRSLLLLILHCENFNSLTVPPSRQGSLATVCLRPKYLSLPWQRTVNSAASANKIPSLTIVFCRLRPLHPWSGRPLEHSNFTVMTTFLSVLLERERWTPCIGSST
ncbi:STE3-domain-containing protein [Tricholoma matsutake]|nr:STE3-domain-containing protein [Tricholoma matsutake 945]